jgi:hypothetical protein
MPLHTQGLDGLTVLLHTAARVAQHTFLLCFVVVQWWCISGVSATCTWWLVTLWGVDKCRPAGTPNTTQHTVVG